LRAIGARRAKRLPMRERSLVLLLCGFTFVVLCVSFASGWFLPHYGAGIDIGETATPYVLRVNGVDAAEAKAGLQRGDLLDLRGQIFDPARWNFPHTLNVLRQGRSLRIQLPPEYSEIPAAEALDYLAQFWMLLFAVLIALRGRSASGSGILATALAVDALSWGLYAFVTPVPWIMALINAVGLALTPLARFVLLTRYFSVFGQPLRGVRLWWTRLAYVAAAASFFAVAMYYFYVFHVTRLPLSVSAAGNVFDVLFQFAVVPVTTCGILAVRAARPEDSARIAWVTGSYGTFFTFWVLAGPLGFLWGAYDDLMWEIETVSHVLVPLGLSYAALRRRVFDIGFVLNRAAIFTGVSLIVVGAFVLLEWSLGTWLGSLGHATSLALNIALALVLGVSLRFVHARVERVIDAVLFRKRHEDERALRSFAHEATFITSEETLLERTIATVERYANVSPVRILLEKALSSTALENDPAILKLKAWSAPLDLHAVDTVLEGEWAYPMIVRGRLVGVLLLGSRRSSESYAPDEAAAIAEVSQGVAGALDALAAKHPEEIDAILEAVNALRTELRAAFGAPQ
jgi:hypothetical protein